MNNFVLFCIALVLIFYAINRFKQHPRISTYTILLISNALLISVSMLIADLFQASKNNIGTTIFTMFNYILRPACIIFMILMTGKITVKDKYFIFFLIPIIINTIVYSLMLIPVARELVVYYAINEYGNLIFHGGSFLRFTSHIVSALYLIYLQYVSFLKVSKKHVAHGLTIFFCSLFVVVAVVVESFFNPDNKIQLLNNTIAVSALVYYLYLYIERAQVDALTGLFNRETFYHDAQKMGNSITGVIQFDMNGLKYLNDKFGHAEGDKGLVTIAEIITKCAKRNMYVYRLGGDENLVLCVNGTKNIF